MKRREAMRVTLGLAGCSMAGWDRLVAGAGAQTPGCSLVPQQTAGPFYFDSKQIRRDIAEGRPGVPLKLALQVVDADSCAPVPGTAVDVWHADAGGIYSGYTRQGDVGDVDASDEDFMRGIQVSDEQGRVEFTTVYPGWYPGRTAHIHFNILFDERTAVTSQLYFPDSISVAVYEEQPYSERGASRTTNENDALLGSGDLDALQMTVLAEGEGYGAAHVLGIVGGSTAVDPTTWGWLKGEP